ncbi:hypothetical protein N6H14_10635 [Paenibacillus sp. CC-CFT747]|nr:hypothetical protein N6H14_10635 [Paenibacillus sp. CC-CFT747]
MSHELRTPLTACLSCRSC